MKKYICLFLSLVLLVIPFSFYELEGPFGLVEHNPTINKQTNQLYMPIERLNITSVLTNSREGMAMSKYRYLLLYSRQAGYSINYLTRHIIPPNDDIINFLQGKNSFNEGQEGGWNRDYKQIYFDLFKEKPNLILDNSKEPIEGIKREFHWPKPSARLGDTYLRAVFTTSSGVKIVNDSNGPKMIKGDQAMKIERGLKRHFHTSHSKLVDVIAKYKLEDNNEKDLMLNAYAIEKSAKGLSDGVFLDPKQADLLDKSKILAVYGIFKNDEGKESLIWGLAEMPDESQPSGKRKFHWMTDLKCDVSELLKL